MKVLLLTLTLLLTQTACETDTLDRGDWDHGYKFNEADVERDVTRRD